MLKLIGKKGLAFVGWLLLSGGASADAPFPFADGNQRYYALSYALGLDEWVEVSVSPQAVSWPIHISYHERGSGLEIDSELNEVLLPSKGHLDEGSPQLRDLSVATNGFTLVIDYPAVARVERYSLSFAHSICLKGAVRCHLSLVAYRHERIQNEQIISGLALDYRTGRVSWLGSTIPPLQVSAKSPAFEQLPNIFDFSPDLGLMKVN